MNRREFLKSLAAIGTSLAIDPSVIAKAPEAEIDTAWQVLCKAPRTFYVNSWGAISSSYGVEYPTSRRALYGFDELPAEDHELRAMIESESVLQDRVEYVFECAVMGQQSGQATNWSDWLDDEDTLAEVRWDLETWLGRHPDDNDWERADLTGITGRGDALQFFRRESEIADTFGIVIVEGDHPGSSYFAAELRMDIAEANQLAEELDLPIRFDQDEE